MSVYLRLFHGRETMDEQMDDWGEIGPTLGPFPFVHETYACDIKLGYGRNNEFRFLTIVGDCVYYNNMYYGDWVAVSEPDENESVEEFDCAKAQLPPGENMINQAEN